MEPDRRSWTPSSNALVMAGVTLIGTGFYFLLLRPSLLPEDIPYMVLDGHSQFPDRLGLQWVLPAMAVPWAVSLVLWEKPDRVRS